MKLSHITSGILLLLSASLHGAIYNSSFTGLGTDNVAGFEGWTVTDPQDHISYGVTALSGEAAALGGHFASPDGPTVGLSHGYDETFGYTVASFSFTIADSTNLAPIRDQFSFSFTEGGTNLYTVFFTPVGPGTADPDGDTNATWDLSYSTGAGPTLPLFISVQESGAYQMSFSFSPNGTSTNFNVGVGALGGDPLDTLYRTGTLGGVDPLGHSDAFTVGWTPTSDAGGDNAFVFDDISVVPEPSSALLLGVVGLGLAMNRRRRA